jgi:hypothetical protein
MSGRGKSQSQDALVKGEVATAKEFGVLGRGGKLGIRVESSLLTCVGRGREDSLGLAADVRWFQEVWSLGRCILPSSILKVTILRLSLPGRQVCFTEPVLTCNAIIEDRSHPLWNRPGIVRLYIA